MPRVRPSRHPRMLVASLVVASAAIAGGARAQETAAAETLFNDGRALLAQGRYAEACAKLTESERLDAAVGTLLNLGDCYEKMGRIATAWAVFRQAAGMALTGKQPARQKIADGRVAALEPKIPKLALVVTHPTPGLEVRRDGTLLGAAEWSASSPSALAMDPGAPGPRSRRARGARSSEAAGERRQPGSRHHARPRRPARDRDRHRGRGC